MVKMYKLSKYVQLLGERNSINDILAYSDIGVLASYQEGFSNSIIECMSAGLPMVVTNVGGNPEAVKDGVNGFLVPTHNPLKIAESLQTLICSQSIRKKMGLASKLIAEKEFSIKKVINSYENIYSSHF